MNKKKNYDKAERKIERRKEKNDRKKNRKKVLDFSSMTHNGQG